MIVHFARRRRALIMGITGQDGSYPAEQLLDRDYEVHATVRRSSSFNTDRIDHLYRDPHEEDVRLRSHFGDFAASGRLVKLIYELQPDKIYRLGAQSHVRVSFDIPEYTADVTGVGALRVLEAIRESGVDVSRARELLGFQAQVPLEDGLRETVRAFRERDSVAA
jgi:GDPmannose 4,6-dehydratase